MASALSGSHSIICFSICGWSAVRPSNILQGCIWGDNLRKQWAFALFPEQHHHQNLLKSKTKAQQSTKGSSPGQAGTCRVAHTALPPTNAFLHLLQINHQTNPSWPKWGAEERQIKIREMKEELSSGQKLTWKLQLSNETLQNFTWCLWSDHRGSLVLGLLHSCDQGDVWVSSNYVSGHVKNSFVHHPLTGWNILSRHTALQYWSIAHFCMSVVDSYKFHPYSFKLRLDELYFKEKLNIACHSQPVSLLHLPWDRKWKLPILIILFRSVLRLGELCSKSIHFTISKYSPWHRESQIKGTTNNKTYTAKKESMKNETSK